MLFKRKRKMYFLSSSILSNDGGFRKFSAFSIISEGRFLSMLEPSVIRYS